MQAQSLPPLPSNRPDNYSPSSAAGSDWSGVNGYNNGALRPDGLFPPARVESMTPPDTDGSSDSRPPMRSQTFAAGTSPPDDRSRRGLSENGSRASSRAASSRASDISLRDPQSRRYQRVESELRQHYAVLRAYLRGGASQPPRTNKARDKLLRLSPVQFHELSTDVFDELQRRQAAQPLPGRPPRQDKVPPYLLARPDFHEKRNQARQKLSSLQTPRFRDLSTDVFCELERRFPHFNPDNRRESARSQSRGTTARTPSSGLPAGPNGFGPPPRAHTTNVSMSSNTGFPPRKGSIAAGSIDVQTSEANEFSRPMPKQFQSNTITPNKSTMVEDDEDDEVGPTGRYDRSSDAFGLESSLASPRSRRDTSATSMTGASREVGPMPLPPAEFQEKVASLEQRLQAKDEEIKELSNLANLKEELQGKLDEAQKLNNSLRDEIEKIRQEHATQIAEVGSNGGEWQAKHDQLDDAHRSLQAKFDDQVRTTDEVRQQFKAHLLDMRAMVDEHNSNMQREEQLHAEIQKLREEAAEWKARYTKAKSQLRNVRASTLGFSVESGNGSKSLHDQTFYSADGIVTDMHVTKFQLSIDEMLGIARTQESTAVLDHVKEVVNAVRGITGDVEKVTTNDKNDDASRKRNKLKTKVSITTNNVITAARNFAAAEGLSPVSLLDAAASHLTAAVVDLLRIVKIRPTPAGEHSDDNESLTPVNKNGYFDVGGHVRRPSAADSVYSALSDPSEPDPRTPVAPTHDQGQTNGNNGTNGNQAQQDEAELEELKVSFESVDGASR